MTNQFTAPKYIAGLDTLRFFAAFWVVMGHGLIFPLTAGFTLNNWTRIINGSYCGGISGPAAVILFFIISGFCIHYPFNKNAQPLNLKEFFSRRYIRILLPMTGALVIAKFLKVDKPTKDFFAGIPAWSLVAELIYYTIYPLLRSLSKKIKWETITIAAYLLAYASAFTVPISSTNYTNAFGIYFGSAILGLPCWLLGVLLANRVRSASLADCDRRKIWRFRIIGIALGGITQNLGLQGIIGQHLTLNLFAIYAYIWLVNEISYFSKNKPSSIFEKLGSMSYSIYLMHIAVIFVLHKTVHISLGYVLDWVCGITVVLIISWLFYQLCEKPSHNLARFVGSKFKTEA